MVVVWLMPLVGGVVWKWIGSINRLGAEWRFLYGLGAHGRFFHRLGAHGFRVFADRLGTRRGGVVVAR